MEQDRKTEIVTDFIANALQEVKNKYGQEIDFSLNADYQRGEIVIRVIA